MPSRKLTDAHAILQLQYPIAKKLFEQNNKGVEVFITNSYRSNAEQTALFNQPHDGIDNDKDGRVDESDERVTNAKAGQSPHNHFPSFAIDVSFLVNGKLDWSEKYFISFAKYMATDKIEWGGTWKSIKDLPHFEVKGFKNLK
jgi:peptidoglycan LD-endopeptidase CwlK